jgi:hypothetical protein
MRASLGVDTTSFPRQLHLQWEQKWNGAESMVDYFRGVTQTGCHTRTTLSRHRSLIIWRASKHLRLPHSSVHQCTLSSGETLEPRFAGLYDWWNGYSWSMYKITGGQRYRSTRFRTNCYLWCQSVADCDPNWIRNEVTPTTQVPHWVRLAIDILNEDDWYGKAWILIVDKSCYQLSKNSLLIKYQ